LDHYHDYYFLYLNYLKVRGQGNPLQFLKNEQLLDGDVSLPHHVNGGVARNPCILLDEHPLHSIRGDCCLLPLCELEPVPDKNRSAKYVIELEFLVKNSKNR